MLQNALDATSAGSSKTAKRAGGVLRRASLMVTACFTLGAIEAAHAQTTPAAAPAPAAPAAPAAPVSWASTIKYSGEIDGGVVGNFDTPDDGINFGQTTTDHANQASLNSLFLTVERDPNTSTTSFDWGFKIQGQYGSDVRYNRYLGEFNHQDTRYMGDIAQAYLTAHLAGLFSGGIDITAGQYVTPLGDEVIDPRVNPFYSHSYIFSYGLPIDHTGGYVVAHPAIADIYLGMDSGVDTSFASGDNNGAASYMAGFGKTIGPVTILALAHFGPEDAHDNSHYRTYADAVITYKYNAALTLTTELDYVNDALYKASAYGGTEYASYALNSTLTLNGRAEVFDDNNNFFVSNPLTDNGPLIALGGGSAPYVFGQKDTTYGELTLGVTYSPPNLPGMLSTLEVRPEVRVDTAFNGAKAFDTDSYGNGGKDTQVTLAADANLTF